MPDEQQIEGASAAIEGEATVPKIVPTNIKKKKTVITVRLDEDVLATLYRYMDATHTSKSQAIRELIEGTKDDAGE